MISYKTFITLFLSLLLNYGFAQNNNYVPYYLKINQANLSSHNGKYYIADSIYNIAFKMVEFAHPKDYISSAINACKMDSLQLAKKYIIKTILSDFPIKEIKNKKKLKPFIKSKYWKEYKKRYKDYTFNIFNDSIRLIINTIYEDDQKYRGNNYLENIENQNKLDSLNLLKIKNIQKTYGKIPGIREVGYQGMMLLYIIFRHVNYNYVVNYLGPQIIKQSKQGDFYAEMGSGIIDYKSIMQVSSNKYRMTYQIYGTQIMVLKGKRIIVPVKNFNEMNILRKNIGLTPINDDYRIEYNEEYVRSQSDGKFEFR